MYFRKRSSLDKMKLRSSIDVCLALKMIIKASFDLPEETPIEGISAQVILYLKPVWGLASGIFQSTCLLIIRHFQGDFEKDIKTYA